MKKQKADLLQGTLELLVLRLLRSGSFNGWDIMQRLQLVSGEVLSVLLPAHFTQRCIVWKNED